MKPFELPPYAPTLIESTRAIGYSLEAAVADIIDNSIAAGASKVDLFFFPVDKEYVAILDNGRGMDDKELTTAMQYGSKNPMDERSKEDLGRFGLGLKTASLSQCRCLTVVTKKEDVLLARRWDIDYVTNTGKWTLLILEEDEMLQLPHVEELLRQIIETKFTNKLPTVDQIYSEADALREVFKDLYPMTDKEFESIKKRLPENILHSIGYADTLRKRDSAHQYGWYKASVNDGFFWNRYKDYLSNTKICNKATNAGYKVIIVLAGMMENLRIQTQERLDAEFVGLDSKYSLDKKADSSMRNIPVGVGKIPPFGQDKRITRFTSVQTDFNAGVIKSNGLKSIC